MRGVCLGVTRITKTALAVAVLLISAGQLNAQTGSITGKALDANTRRPLVGAQVFITGLRIGGLTSNDGRYLITNVPVGSQKVEVTLIGYGSVSQQVNVSAGAAVALDFELRTSAISLDEIVVTGSGVQEQRRQLGSSSASIGANTLASKATLDITSALRGQVAGVMPSNPQGEVGAAAPMRIRGQVSLTQRNDPIVYIDGVRQDASMGQIGAIHTSRLDDINPADIDRIEVIKGAAAATLFGTEASAGVIQIFTKKGVEGTAKYTFAVDQGGSRVPLKTIPANLAYDRVNKKMLTNNPLGDIAQTGYLQNYSGSVSGGTTAYSYFVSGRFRHETGAVPNSLAQNMSLRTSLDMNHSPKLRTEFALNVVRGKTQTPAGSTTIGVGSSRVDLQACKLEYSIVSPK